ncbi:MAG TPA: cation-translocating P-type ATPase [Chitinophagaceae bacterium]|nr:cation-translocating P-type ATPase [Chitinophagaceae bacterium]HEX5654862.1 cation-translocating P-type ATPase [Chitinophagaceae bacterium]
MKAVYQLSKEELLKQFKTSEKGLKTDAIPGMLKEFGPNELKETKPKSKWAILLSQFTDVMILVLVIAAIISFVVGEHTDALVILAIIIANAWMGYSQESNAEESIRMLKKMAAQYATVIREGHPIKIEASELVPGDLILLDAGDIVPADARLIELHSLKTDESSLTGESHSVEKTTESIQENNLVPGDQLNMVFKTTIISNGSAKAIVTSTGMNTEIGKIAGMMETGYQKTPLQKRLAVFSKQLAVIVIIVCLLVFGLGLWRGEPAFRMFLTALSLAVAALPEALPAVITIALARGARRMVKQKALIRKLPAVETLGSVTYICTDKTGTLTQNLMTVEKVEAEPGKEDLLNYAMLLDNEVRFAEDGDLMGDSTEKALVHYSLGTGFDKKEADKKFPLSGKLPFDSDRMLMSTLHRDGDKWILFTKGAPAKMVEILSEKYKDKVPGWLERNREWAADGLRVLFFGSRTFDQDPGKPGLDLEKDLDFLGMTAMIDPPREEVIDSIRQCKTAGIKIVMITGDQSLTAKAIAERLEIFNDDTTDVKTGSDLDKLTEEEFIKKVRNISVYARVSPEQKLTIVKALQHNGEFVAMTGDGVNDAPSLKQSDIGLAMGITGTDVSKEAADMILLDDNFATIVKAVREGRRIYENIRKFIQYVLSCNLSEILTIFIAPFLGFAVPLLPIHILWINLVTDGLPGIALVAEPAEKNIMKHKPRPPKENLFAGGLITTIVITGIIMTIAALFIQWWAIRQGYDLVTQQTMVFTTLCFVQLGNALSSRSKYQSIISKTLFSNRGMWVAIVATIILQLLIIYVPFLDPIFKTTVLAWDAMLTILLVTLASIVCIELLKLFNYRKYRKEYDRLSKPEKIKTV